MKTMREYDLVRRLFYVEDWSRHEISRFTGIHRKTIAKMLLYSSPPGYHLRKPRPKTRLGPYLGIVDQILEDDRAAPPKQRHTAWRIFCRLRDEYGFDGGYTIVKDCVREKRLGLREVFLPLEQRPGTSQIDFGKAEVIISGQEQKAHLFCLVLPYSDALFVRAYPTEALEALQDGHNAAYAFFGGVKRFVRRGNPVFFLKYQSFQFIMIPTASLWHVADHHRAATIPKQLHSNIDKPYFCNV